MHGREFGRRTSETDRSQTRRSLRARTSCAGRAIGHLDDALTILRTLDDDIYWNLAAAACDAADDLRGGLDRDADEDGLLGEVTLDDTRLAPHRTAVAEGLHRLRVTSATASALDMVAHARSMVLGPRGNSGP